MSFLDFVFPKVCLGCGKNGEYLCGKCKKQLVVHSQICPVCHKFSKNGFSHLECNSSLDGIIIGFRYGKLVRKLVYQLKYNSRYQVADFMGSQIAMHILANQNFDLWQKQKTAISYVPAHRSRKFYFRGYNQSEKLAKVVGKILDLPIIFSAKKIKKTSSQAKLDRQKRFLNLKGAFESQKLDYQNILIVDDITTTCSTLIELAKEIKKSNPRTKVWGVVFARNY